MNNNTLFYIGGKKSIFGKLSALLLTFLFILQPLAPVFAQETAALPTASAETSSPVATETQGGGTKENGPILPPAPKDDNVPPASPGPAGGPTKADQPEGITPVSNVDATDTGTQAMRFGNPDSTNTNLAPSTIKVLVPDADQTTGALTYSYPITVPPGRNGLQPDLALSYNNQTMEEGSIFGMGWGANIPYIDRINRTGSNKLYTDNYFNSSMSGELVSITSSSYSPKVENGDFLKYAYASNTWTVTDKKGTVYKFGSSAATRQDNPSDSTKIYKWMLEEVRDTNNNYIKYEYYKDGGQIYPSKITYTGNGTTDGIFEISFLRQSRTDIVPIDKAGFSVSTNYRIYEIDAKVNSTLVHKYALAYMTGDNGVRSLLSSITESGTDEVTTTTVTLPATSFTSQTSTNGWTQDTNLTIPVTFVWPNGEDGGARIIDVNGDGLQDLVVSDASSSVHAVYINNGNGWSSSSWTVPLDITDVAHKDTGFRFSDINADNLPDILYSKQWDYIGGEEKYVYINTGTGWTLDTSWTIPVYFSNPPFTDTGGRIADVNGDGLPDMILSDRPSTTKSVYINSGTNWVYDSSWTVPIYFDDINSKDAATVLTDVNGDGQADILQSDEGTATKSVYINTGTGWAIDSTWGTIPEYFLDSSHKDRGVRFADINSDGLMDMVISYLIQDNQYGHIESKHAYINTGKGWTENTSITIPGFFVDPGNADTGARFTDIKGSNLADIIVSKHTGPGTDDKSAQIRNGTKRSDLLSRVTYPQGGKTDITYKPSTQYTSGGTALNPNLPFILDTVYQLSTDDGAGGTAVVDTYKYEGGKYYFNTALDRKFAGFSAITKTNSASTSVKNFFHQGNTTNSSQGEYSDEASKIGKIYRTEIADGSGNIYLKIINKWDKYNQGTNRDFVKLVRSTSETFDGDSDHKDTSTEYTYDNTYGNVTTKTMWGEVTGADDGSYTDTGTDKAVETIAYTANTTDWIVGLPYQDTVVDQSVAKVKETKTYYDTQSLGTVTDGNPTKMEQWKTSSTYINSQKAYNTTYGIVTSATDPRGKVTSYSYDTYNLYPATVTDPLTHATSYTYDYSSGKIKQTTDQNGYNFYSSYDGLDRTTYEKVPDFVSPYSAYSKTSYVYTDTSGATSVLQTDFLDVSTSLLTYQYFDGLNRIIQDRKEDEASGYYDAKDYAYNNTGQLQKESLRYSSSGSSKTSPTGTTTLYINYTYDPMQRISTQVNNVGTTSYAYDDWKKTVTDPRSKVKNYYTDAYGNLVKVEEINSGSTYTTNYEWNLNNNLTKITDASSNIRNFTYDGLGRRLTAQDLHAPSDTTYGSWSYTYDDAGNMMVITMPIAQTITSTFDDVNRQLTEDYSNSTGIEMTNTYDSCTNGIGRICTGAMSNGANTSYTYDSLGNKASEVITINSTNYTTSYTYDRQGHIVTITTPDSAQIKNTFNTAGLLNKIERKESGGSFTNVVSDFDYNPMDQITTEIFTNGVTTTNTYDATKLYRLTRRLTQNTVPTKFQDLNYTYDNNGNITQIVDASNTDSSKTVAYVYDDLNRLNSATATGVAAGQSAYTLTFTYDAIGNITNKSDVGNYTYAGNTGTLQANPHAATSINGVTYTYDRQGNLTSNGTMTNVWNYRDQMTQTTIGAVVSNSWYDHTGTRVRYRVGSASTYYPNKYYNTDGTKKTKQIYAGDTLVATTETISGTTTPYYVHTDNILGSGVISDGSGAKNQLLDYLPYGGIRINQQATSFKEQKQFSGHMYDADTGLNYLGARFYYGKNGQFISEDPSFWTLGTDVTQLTNPQTLNSYSYAGDNPIINRDPDGKCFWDACMMETMAVMAGVQTVASLLTGAYVVDYIGTQLNPKVPASVKAQYRDQLVQDAGVVISGGLGTGAFSRTGAGVNTQATAAAEESAGIKTFSSGEYEVKLNTDVKTSYSRPANATTSAQKASVQGNPCVDCGATNGKMIADHKTPLMKEYYETGSINLEKMRSTQAVQSQCATCSAQQGAALSNISKQIKTFIKSK